MKIGKRLHWKTARKMWMEGKEIGLCPCKLSPRFTAGGGHPVFLHTSKYDPDKYWNQTPEEGWKNLCRNFKYYNCTMNETGYHISYWKLIKEDES